MLHDVLDLDEARRSPHLARRRQVRIRNFLRVALEIVRVEGREALTLKRVAERQGLTASALYRHFSSKDVLVAELQRAVISELARMTRERVTRADVFAREAALSATERALLGVIVSAFVFKEFSRSAPVKFGILSMGLSAPEFTLPDRETAQVLDVAWSALSDLVDQLRTAQECGALDAGEEGERAVALWAGLQGVVQARKLARSAPDRIDSTRIARGLVSALLVGWGASPDDVSRMVGLARAQRFAELPESTDDDLDGPGD